MPDLDSRFAAICIYCRKLICTRVARAGALVSPSRTISNKILEHIQKKQADACFFCMMALLDYVGTSLPAISDNNSSISSLTCLTPSMELSYGSGTPL